MTSPNAVAAVCAKAKKRRTKRVPVVLQMCEGECGAACLAMVLNFFGRATHLAECRRICDGGRDGVTCRTLVRAARSQELHARAFAVGLEDVSHIAAPAILFWNSNHFVVLEGWSDNKIRIVDPAIGRRTLTQEAFRASFSGVVLTFEPTADFAERHVGAPSVLRPHLAQVWRIPGVRRTMAEIVAASLVLQMIGFALPLFTKILVDSILPGHRLNILSLLGIGALALAAVNLVVSYARSVLLTELQTRVDEHLMRGFFEHMLALPFRFFQQRNCGDLVMRLAGNTGIREALASYTTSAVLDSLLVLVFLGALLKVAPVFGLAALVLAALEFGVLLGSTRHLNQLIESGLAAQAESQNCLVEALMGIGTLKAAGAENATLTRWSTLLKTQLETSARRSKFASKVEAGVGLVRSFAPLGLLWLGGWEVANNGMPMGTMFALNALATSFLQPMGSLVMSAQRIHLAKACLERIADVMQSEREQSARATEPAGVLSGSIELRDVTFKYDSNAPNVLSGITLRVEPGQKIAVVGRTGSGKSTLAKLLLGLYEPSHGVILFDGRPLPDLCYPTVRQQWGTVMQDGFVFSASIRENIAFCRASLPMNEIVKAAQLAGMHDDIMGMPMGYETRIGEGGNNLSGGQKQRLALARALAGNPRMLLLDEATSQLDVLTESKVDGHLSELGCTIIVVAHRLSTVRSADMIVVLRDGRIVERGTHDELMTIAGEYAELVKIQNRSRQAPPSHPAETGESDVVNSCLMCHQHNSTLGS